MRLAFSMIFLKTHVTQSWTFFAHPTFPTLLSSMTHSHSILWHAVPLERMTSHFPQENSTGPGRESRMCNGRERQGERAPKPNTVSSNSIRH